MSHKELREELEKKKLLNQMEIEKVIQYIDPENKGFISYTEFNQKIRKNVNHQDFDGNPRTISFATPNAGISKNFWANQQDYKRVWSATKAPFIPDQYNSNSPLSHWLIASFEQNIKE